MNDCTKSMMMIACQMTMENAWKFLTSEYLQYQNLRQLLDDLEQITEGGWPKVSTRSGLSLLRKGGSAQEWFDHETLCEHQCSNHRTPWVSTDVDDLIFVLRKYCGELEEQDRLEEAMNRLESGEGEVHDLIKE